MRSFPAAAGTSKFRAASIIALVLWTAPAFSQEQPEDFAKQANVKLDPVQSVTDPELGAVQGIVVRDGKVYAYGDRVHASPRTGVVREYDLNLRATGRTLLLNRDGVPLIIHPTGLTWDERWGTFLGDTVKKKATVYRLDWVKAWQDGNLDRAVLATLDDDVAINGCRPLFVQLDGRTLLATADYGDVRPELRLYDPEAFLAHGRSSAPNVVLHRVLCGPFNQNLAWDERAGTLTCVQNVIEGKGWRLDRLDLRKAVADGRVGGTGVRQELLTFPYSDELEGFWQVDDKQVLFAAARRRDNLVLGSIQASRP